MVGGGPEKWKVDVMKLIMWTRRGRNPSPVTGLNLNGLWMCFLRFLTREETVAPTKWMPNTHGRHGVQGRTGPVSALVHYWPLYTRPAWRTRTGPVSVLVHYRPHSVITTVNLKEMCIIKLTWRVSSLLKLTHVVSLQYNFNTERMPTYDPRSRDSRVQNCGEDMLLVYNTQYRVHLLE